ncbi:MAG TPA: hypothetical protein VHM47_08740 [Actinomycetota bacterium]|nr:hypothetical protein [Actinomycetota bacterium]
MKRCASAGCSALIGMKSPLAQITPPESGTTNSRSGAPPRYFQ